MDDIPGGADTFYSGLLGWSLGPDMGPEAGGDRPFKHDANVSGTYAGALHGDDAQRVAAVLTVSPPSAGSAHTVAEALDAWLDTNRPTWAASTRA